MIRELWLYMRIRKKYWMAPTIAILLIIGALRGQIRARWSATQRSHALHPLNRLWTRVGLAVGKAIRPLPMAIVFAFVISPQALVRRWLLRRSPVPLRPDAAVDSYWIERGEEPASSMTNQFRW